MDVAGILPTLTPLTTVAQTRVSLITVRSWDRLSRSFALTRFSSHAKYNSQRSATRSLPTVTGAEPSTMESNHFHADFSESMCFGAWCLLPSIVTAQQLRAFQNQGRDGRTMMRLSLD